MNLLPDIWLVLVVLLPVYIALDMLRRALRRIMRSGVSRRPRYDEDLEEIDPTLLDSCQDLAQKSEGLTR